MTAKELKEAQDYLRSRDKKLVSIIDQVEISDVQPVEDVYMVMIDSIISQQLSVKAAGTICNRFLALFPEHFSNPYPVAENVLALDDKVLRSVGLSGQKAGYIKNLAAFSQANPIDRKHLDAKSDPEVIEYLTQIKGVGRWTVEMLLMFSLARTDVFPVDDLGIRQGMTKLYKLKVEKRALRDKMTLLAEKWRPHRTLACRYIWRFKDTVGL